MLRAWNLWQAYQCEMYKYTHVSGCLNQFHSKRAIRWFFFAVVCPPGSHFQNDECIPCPLGYYQYETGRSSCIKCPVGKTTNSYGAISADQCKLNSYFLLSFVFWIFFFICKFEKKKKILPLGFLGWIWSLLHTFRDKINCLVFWPRMYKKQVISLIQDVVVPSDMFVILRNGIWVFSVSGKHLM